MISYDPLHETLREKNMVISQLRGKVLNSKTISKIYKNQSVNLSTIEKICKTLQVPIERVVKIE